MLNNEKEAMFLLLHLKSLRLILKDCRYIIKIGNFVFVKKKVFCLYCFRFAVFAHIIKWRKMAQNESNLAMQRAKSLNAARYVCKHNTLRLKFNHVIFTETPCQKVCKNTVKWPILLCSLCKTALLDKW